MIHSRFEACQKQSLHQVPLVSPTLIVVRQGEKRVYNGRDVVRLPAGKAVLLPAGVTPQMENIPANGRYLADIFAPPRSWVERFRQQYGHLLTELPHPQDASFTPDARLETALQACYGNPSQPDAAWHSARLELAWHQVILEMVRLQVAASLFVASSQPVADRLRELLNFSPSQAWQASKIARQWGMSPATLRRRLQAEGTSFSQLLQESRMARALGLLMTTPAPIGEIAWQCGYEAIPAFSHAFKKHYGISPSELRATQQIPTTTEQLA